LETREESIIGIMWKERGYGHVTLDHAPSPTCSTRYHGGQVETPSQRIQSMSPNEQVGSQEMENQFGL